MPPDSSEVDAALVSKLLADATLMALVPDGVFIDAAAAGAQRFVIVSLVDHTDEPMFGATAYEDAVYLVKAVVLSTTGANIKAAAARIDTLLHYGSMAPTGYSLMALRRIERVRYTEVDEVDRTIRWQHRGGRYQVTVSP